MFFSGYLPDNKNFKKVNSSSYVCTLPDTKAEDYSSYICALTEKGLTTKETYENEYRHFSALVSPDGIGAFVNYYPQANEMSVVFERDTKYFNYSDNACTGDLPVQLSQLPLEDFGMSYVIRLSDGRFIIIDGGREFEIEADRLLEFLKANSNGKPTVAAWILTHPHCDHVGCFNTLLDKYKDEIILEKLMFTFPDADLEQYPKLIGGDKRVPWETSGIYLINKTNKQITEFNIPVYSPRAGQRYTVGDANIEFIATMDDAVERPVQCGNHINALALVFRMEICGQTILFMTDGPFGHTRLCERYGKYLKSDILQAPHHAYGTGSNEDEIRGYKLVRPSVCLISASEYVTYTMFSSHKSGTEYLLRYADVDEVILADKTTTITLPYTAPKGIKEKAENKYLTGMDSCGSKVWIFTELCTDNKEDFIFDILNTVNVNANISMDLFFDDKAFAIKHILTTVEKYTIKNLNIVGDEVDADAKYCDWDSLKVKGIPKGKPFALRIMSDIPIVVSHKTHSPAFSAPNR